MYYEPLVLVPVSDGLIAVLNEMPPTGNVRGGKNFDLSLAEYGVLVNYEASEYALPLPISVVEHLASSGGDIHVYAPGETRYTCTFIGTLHVSAERNRLYKLIGAWEALYGSRG